MSVTDKKIKGRQSLENIYCLNVRHVSANV